MNNNQLMKRTKALSLENQEAEAPPIAVVPAVLLPIESSVHLIQPC
jgi:hypothetical protein